MSQPQWEKPGPGTWLLDSSHCGPAPGPILRELYESCLPRGMADGFELFGSPLKTMDMRWVNGKFYRRLVPLVGGDRDLPTPPRPVLWLASRLHPAFRAQEKRAAESFEVKRWREEIARWENDWKPSITKKNLGFADVDVAAIDDATLAAHIRDLSDHLHETVKLHFRLHVSDMGPLGNLMVHLEEWGLSVADAFRALVAASPATGAPARQLRDLADAITRAGVDVPSLASLDEVRAASPECASLLDDYLRHHGWRLTTGYDLEDRALIELPHAIVASIRGAAARDDRAAADAAAEALVALRAEVPADHRHDFDDVVEDARVSYGLRDENGPVTYEWPAGLLRRALLEAGRRLAANGGVSIADRIFELGVDEIGALLEGRGGPTAADIDAKAEERAWWATLDAPERLGPEEPPPPVDVLPPNLARLTRIVTTVVAALEADTARTHLSGIGIGDAVYTGTARVVRDASEAFDVVEPGDVIIAPYTAPTYNAVLAMAGAVVTQEGGLLCHAAVIARELGIPAVVGAKDAMTAVPDGATIEVDAVAGVVRIL